MLCLDKMYHLGNVLFFVNLKKKSGWEFRIDTKIGIMSASV